jgi:hypothetical protein
VIDFSPGIYEKCVKPIAIHPPIRYNGKDNRVVMQKVYPVLKTGGKGNRKGHGSH